MVRAGVEAGADLVAVETMGDLHEARAAILAAKEAGGGAPVFATVTFDGSGRMLSGADLAAAAAVLGGAGADVIGMNCGLGPHAMAELAAEMAELSGVPVFVKPNAGLPRLEDGRTVYDIGTEEFAEAVAGMVRRGVRVAGGCCGTTPEHIAARRKACGEGGAWRGGGAGGGGTGGASGTRAVGVGGGRCVIIGERINPTGKKAFQAALRAGDMGTVLRTALAQTEAGADILDVNVGVPGLDERALLERTVREVQGVCDAPLQLDTADPAAMEAALRAYNGKALVNSVNGKAAVLAAVLPLVKKYGGAVVGLCLDENGIPATAEGRLAVAQKIVAAAEAEGIARKDVVIDVLCMTVAADAGAARETLRALELVRRELGVETVLGLSNVSHGLPRRDIVNAAFFVAAARAGLGAAIANPNSAALMGAHRALRALEGLDADCGDYIRFCGTLPADAPAAGKAAGTAGGAAPTSGGSATAAAPGDGLGEIGGAVRRGLKEDARRLTAAALDAGRAPLDIVNGELVPALDAVGKGFEAKTLFLPQLLMSADAAGAAFEAIKARLAGKGEARKAAGRVILATVKGDIHDIGKNIVKVMLENYGFEVVDLGKDVPPETVLEAVRREKIPLVGLSALMTTTTGAMSDTIRLLRKETPGTKVMVGGAVLTEEYAREIGADFYSKDAMGSVRYAQEVFGGA